ncbi:hypothetical protein Tco_0434185, partial [Tanacetum coccineum]
DENGEDKSSDADDEGRGSDDEGHGLDDEGRSVESDGLCDILIIEKEWRMAYNVMSIVG